MKKNNTKVTKKARIGIAALAMLMTMSCAAPLAASAADPANSENAEMTVIDENQDFTADVQDLTVDNQAVIADNHVTIDANQVLTDETQAVTEETQAKADENQAATEETQTVTNETQAVTDEIEAKAAVNQGVPNDNLATSNLKAASDDNKPDGKDDKDDKDDKDGPIIDPSDTTNLMISIIKGDDNMKNLLRLTESSVQGIIKKIPEISYIASPMLEIIKVLYESDQPEPTIELVSKQLESIQGQIDDAKETIIEAMGTMSDMSKFMDQYNLFDSKYKEVSKQVSHISGYNMSQDTKNLRLAEMVGKVSDWYSNDNLVFNLIALGSYLSGETKLVSGQKTIYDAMMDYYSHIVLFGKEAMEKTENLTADALAVYLESSTQMINCIIAKRNVLLMEGTENSLCDADYCKSKIRDILNQIVRVNDTLDAYKTNNDPLTLYDRTGDVQRNIVLAENMVKADFGKKKPMNDLVGSKALSDKQLKSIVEYVKKHFPGWTLQEYLTYVGFNFSGKTYETYLAEYEKERANAEKALKEAEEILERKANETPKQQDIIFPEIPGMSFFDPIQPSVWTDWEKVHAENTVKEMTEFLAKDPMTKDEYIKSCKASDGAFFLTSRGRKNSTSMSSGTAADYYYKGVGLQDTSCKEKENRYLYISEGFSTTKRNEAKADMYFLVAK